VDQALKRRFLGLTLILSLLLISFLLVQDDTLIVYAADSYGNDINFVEVWQYNGSAYNLLANFTVTGGSVRVHDSWPTNFTVGIQINSTLVSSTADAIAYTRVYMNITDGGSIWNNVELNNTACSLSGSYYYLTEQGHWNQTGKPVAGVTYACSILYQAYY
jgi:hypothetical protein